jgi:transcriptional regulator with XRE-family HTH domain
MTVLPGIAESSKSKHARHLLARRLRALRFVRGWSQEALAEASGLHRTYISSIERAACNVGLDNLEKLAVGLEVALADLLSEREPAGLREQGGGVGG